MKERKYHREELDTFDEVLKEMQTLRDEVVAESQRLANGIDAVSSATGAGFEEVAERLALLENPPKTEPTLKKPPKKSKKK